MNHIYENTCSIIHYLANKHKEAKDISKSLELYSMLDDFYLLVIKQGQVVKCHNKKLAINQKIMNVRKRIETLQRVVDSKNK